MKDPLDQKIDALMSSRPLKPSDDFAARVLAAAEDDRAPKGTTKRPLGKLLAFALPLAAAIALTISLLPLSSDTVGSAPEAPALSNADAQEIFLLEESLSSLAAVGTTDFGSEELLDALDALYLEI